ncbi:hypothetical protein ACI51X_10535 [Pectobacterium versatile]|uniref:hypothetical protein n=1 Tax=Pectobacterium versatile TaxID=2488639 RepID=UPI00386D2DB7
MKDNPVTFIETAKLLSTNIPKPLGMGLVSDALDLDKLPDAVVTGNTLVDFSKSTLDGRGPLALALTFATQYTNDTVGTDASEDVWFAAYKSTLLRLGLNVSSSTFTRSTFRQTGLAVHKAIIPFLTSALGGVGVGPVILALLENLKEDDKNQPWIRLFDQQSKRLETKEIYLGAVSSDANNMVMHHVAARLSVDDRETSILFFKINNTAAEFESATTTITANIKLLSVLEKPLLERLGDLALNTILAAKLTGAGPN